MLSILLNKELIKINQDPLRTSIKRIKKVGTLLGGQEYQIWTGPHSNGDQIFLVLNERSTPQRNVVDFKQVKLAAIKSLKMKDLWTGHTWMDKGFTSSTIPAHGTWAVRISTNTYE
jgi:alpha-galactosidase